MAITVHLSEILKERGMTALLLLDLSGGVLAHPEQPGTEQDRFVGFHLVYEPAPLPREERNIEDEHWVEYGTQTLDAGPCGSVPLPQKVLPGEEQEDGTVYLNGHGSSYAGGGDFGFNQTRSKTERINGDVTQQSTFEFSVDVQIIPRSDAVSIQQYSRDQRLLREDTLTAGEAMDLGGAWTLPWAEGAAYTLAVKHNSDGTRTFDPFPEPYREDYAASLTVWFLDTQGMGVPVTVELERTAPA